MSEILEFILELLLHVGDVARFWRFGLTAAAGFLILWALENVAAHPTCRTVLTAATVAITIVVGVGWEMWAHH